MSSSDGWGLCTNNCTFSLGKASGLLAELLLFAWRFRPQRWTCYVVVRRPFQSPSVISFRARLEVPLPSVRSGHPDGCETQGCPPCFSTPASVASSSSAEIGLFSAGLRRFGQAVRIDVGICASPQGCLCCSRFGEAVAWAALTRSSPWLRMELTCCWLAAP